MSSTFSSDIVIRNVELRKCLWKDRVVMSDMNEWVAIKLLCSALMLEQDVEHLQVQSSYLKGRVV